MHFSKQNMVFFYWNSSHWFAYWFTSLFLRFILVKWERLGSINFLLTLLIDSTIDCSIPFKSNMDSYFFEYLFEYLYIARNGQITKLGVSRFHFAMMIIFAMLLLLLWYVAKMISHGFFERLYNVEPPPSTLCWLCFCWLFVNAPFLMFQI